MSSLDKHLAVDIPPNLPKSDQSSLATYRMERRKRAKQAKSGVSRVASISGRGRMGNACAFNPFKAKLKSHRRQHEGRAVTPMDSPSVQSTTGTKSGQIVTPMGSPSVQSTTGTKSGQRVTPMDSPSVQSTTGTKSGQIVTPKQKLADIYREADAPWVKQDKRNIGDPHKRTNKRPRKTAPQVSGVHACGTIRPYDPDSGNRF